MTIGIDGAVSTVLGYLQAALGPIVAGAPTMFGSAGADLDPVRVFDRARKLQPGEYPAVLVEGLDTVKVAQGETDMAGGEMLTVTYSLRAWCWTYGAGFDDCDRRRNLYATAVRFALVTAQTFGGSGNARLTTPSSIRESFSSVDGQGVNKFIAGAWLSFNVAVDEDHIPLATVANPSFGPVSAVALTVSELP